MHRSVLCQYCAACAQWQWCKITDAQKHKSTKAQSAHTEITCARAHKRAHERANPLNARTPHCTNPSMRVVGSGSVSVWYGRVAGEELPRYGAVRPGVCGQQVEVPTGGVREMGCQRHQGGGGVTTRWGDGHVSHVCLVLHCTALYCIALHCAVRTVALSTGSECWRSSASSLSLLSSSLMVTLGFDC